MEGSESIPGKKWSEMTEQEHRRYPGDWEAQIERVRGGEDPVGVAFESKDARIEVISGNFFSD